jgi:hypothetical protein
MAKGERSGGDGILGSTAIFGTVDTVVFLRRYDDCRTISTIQRYGEDMEETVLNFDSETRIISLGNTKSIEEQLRVEKDILEFLTQHPQGVAEKEICKNIEGRTQLQKKSLRKLVTARSVERFGKGRRNDPYVYSKNTGSEDHTYPSTGTREPESNPPPCTNTQNSSFLVPNILKEPQNQYLKKGVTNREMVKNTGSGQFFTNEIKDLFPGTTIYNDKELEELKKHS